VKAVFFRGGKFGWVAVDGCAGGENETRFVFACFFEDVKCSARVGFEVFDGIFHAIWNNDLCCQVVDNVKFWQFEEFFKIEYVAFYEFCFWIILNVFYFAAREVIKNCYICTHFG